MSFSLCACFELPDLVDWSKKEIELLNLNVVIRVDFFYTEELLNSITRTFDFTFMYEN